MARTNLKAHQQIFTTYISNHTRTSTLRAPESSDHQANLRITPQTNGENKTTPQGFKHTNNKKDNRWKKF